MLKIIYKSFLDEKQEKIDLKRLMKCKNTAARLLPSKSVIENKENTFRISMYAIDSSGAMYVVRSNYVDEVANMTAFLGRRDAFEAELAWTLLFELQQELSHT